MPRKFLDPDHPWLRPLWARILVVALPAGWAVFEFVEGSPFWGVLFLGLAGYAAWVLFLDPDRRRPG